MKSPMRLFEVHGYKDNTVGLRKRISKEKYEHTIIGIYFNFLKVNIFSFSKFLPVY